MPLVGDYMNPRLVYLREGDRPEVALRPMLDFGIHAVPILDDDRLDIFRRVERLLLRCGPRRNVDPRSAEPTEGHRGIGPKQGRRRRVLNGRNGGSGKERLRIPGGQQRRNVCAYAAE